jgi:uncharacterized membrane protein YdbT with pleckstrin-like domain
MREIDKVLERGEEVIWEGVPVKGPFMLKRLVLGVFFLAFFGLFLFPMFLPAIPAAIDQSPWFLLCCSIPAFLTLTFVVLLLWWVAISYRNTYYALTNRRLIIQKGVIGRDFSMVEFHRVTHSGVNVGFFDKMIGGSSGSLKVHTAGTGGQKGTNLVFENIADPYDLFKLLDRKTSSAVKKVSSFNVD